MPFNVHSPRRHALSNRSLPWTSHAHRLGAALLLASGGPLAAQTLPPAVLDRLDPGVVLNEQLRRLGNAAPRPRADTAPEEPRVVAPPAPEMRATVQFETIEFSRSTLLPDEDLRQLAAGYLSRPLTTDDLQALIDGVGALYEARGVITAAAVLPRQDLGSGRLRVLLVEGRLGAVRVTGDDGIDEGWVRAWFDLPAGEVVQADAVRQRLVLFNSASDRSASASFQAGDNFGVTDLMLDVAATPRWQGWSFVESTLGEDSTGLQSAVGLRWSPVGSRGGRLETALLSAAAGKTLSLGASMPLGQDGWRTGLNLAGSRSTTVLVGQGGAPLRLDGESRSWALELSRTAVLGGPWLGVFSGQFGRIHSTTAIGSLTIFDREVERAQIGASVSRDTADARSTLRSSLVHARSGKDTTRYLDMGFSHLQPWGESRRWSWRINGVVRGGDSGTPLASESLLLGGAETVRGYDPGSSSGESGHAVQLELRHRTLSSAGAGAEVYVFWDQGRARHRGSAAVGLDSVGLGLQARLNAQLGFDLTASRQRLERSGSTHRLALRMLASF